MGNGMGNGTGIKELDSFELGQTVYFELDENNILGPAYAGWHKAKITNLIKDAAQGNWAETYGPLGHEMLDLVSLRHSKSQASSEIDRLKAWRTALGPCHYCGQPAFKFGFFDELNCKECS